MMSPLAYFFIDGWKASPILHFNHEHRHFSISLMPCYRRFRTIFFVEAVATRSQVDVQLLILFSERIQADDNHALVLACTAVIIIRVETIVSFSLSWTDRVVGWSHGYRKGWKKGQTNRGYYTEWDRTRVKQRRGGQHFVYDLATINQSHLR